MSDSGTPVTQEDSKMLDRLAIGRSLKIDDIADMERHQERLDRIMEWAQAKGAKSRDDYIAELAHLRSKIGNPSIFDLSVYIDLDMRHMERLKAKEELEAGIQESETRLKKFNTTGRNEKGQFV